MLDSVDGLCSEELFSHLDKFEKNVLESNDGCLFQDRLTTIICDVTWRKTMKMLEVQASGYDSKIGIRGTSGLM